LGSTVLQWFRRLIKRIGLGGVQFRDVRHSYATTCLLRDVPVKIVSAQPGHANIVIALQVYVLPGMGDRASDAMEAALA
jgi:integrase